MTQDEADAFCVRDGRVVATGQHRDLTDRFIGAEHVDFGEATVTPGFNDAHMHLLMAAEDLLHLDLSAAAVGSLAEIKARIGAEAARTPPGELIRGSRYDDAKMAEGRVLTRFDLDEVAPDHPVLVIHVAAHWGVANSRALELAGIDDGTEAPPGGAYGHDASGRHNGVLYEQALFDVANPQVSRTGRAVAPPSTFEDRLVGVSRAVRMFHAAGLTSIGDAMVGAGDLGLLAEAERRGILTLRVNALISAEQYDAVRAAGDVLAGSERLRIGGIKTFVDGAIGGRTCLLEQPFEGTSDDYGIQTRTEGELREVVRMAHEDGMAACVHANGDRAIKLILDVFEEAEAEHPRRGPGDRIEHCSIVSEDILRRMRRLGATAVPFGSYVHYHGAKLLDWYGERRVARMFAHRWLIDAGVGVAGSSDYPCGPYEPLLALQSCVTRTGYDGGPIGEGQRISPYEALSLYTTRAAGAAGEPGVEGRLAPGQQADFVVLGDDPLTADPTTLASIPVIATYVGGARVWSADEV
jgi:predicted amidohydrolase YtcJ